MTIAKTGRDEIKIRVMNTKLLHGRPLPKGGPKLWALQQGVGDFPAREVTHISPIFRC